MIMIDKNGRRTTGPGSELKVRGLAFSEKFTTLHKVIANTAHIGKPVDNIGTKLSLIAITLLNSKSIPTLYFHQV